MHVRLYLIRTFLEKVATAPDATLQIPLKDLTRLYAFDLISASQGEFLKVKIQQKCTCIFQSSLSSCLGRIHV